jgi:hypothetical protein
MEHLTKDNIKRIYISLVDEYDFDMEAYADVAMNIVAQNESNPVTIGELMLVLRDVYVEGEY